MRPWLVLEGTSVSSGRASAWAPVVDLLKPYFALAPADDRGRSAEKVLGKVLLLDEALRPILPAVLALLDLPVEDAAWQALDPPQRRRRTLDGIKALLVRESQRQPLALVLEDLHWIDGETQALLDSLVESLPTCRMLLLVNYRPDYRHGWGSRAHYTQLRIDPLEPAGAEELLAVLLGDAPDLRELRHRLLAASEGNPLFLEESVRILVDAGVLSGARGAYRLARQPDTIEIPASVAAIIAARIDRLGAAEKAALQLAAVIGEEAPLALLEAVSALPAEELHGALADLRARELLYEARLFPDIAYAFRHGLTRRVAYDGLVHESRRTLHARVAAGDRGAPRRPPRRGRRDARPPLRARRRLAEGSRVFPARGGQGEAALHLPERAGVCAKSARDRRARSRARNRLARRRSSWRATCTA